MTDATEDRFAALDADTRATIAASGISPGLLDRCIRAIVERDCLLLPFEAECTFEQYLAEHRDDLEVQVALGPLAPILAELEKRAAELERGIISISKRIAPDGFLVVHPRVCGLATQAEADRLYRAYQAFTREPSRVHVEAAPNRWAECQAPPEGTDPQVAAAWHRGFRTAMAMGLRSLGDYWSRMLGPVFALKAYFEDDHGDYDKLVPDDLRDHLESVGHMHMTVFDAIEGHAEDAPDLAHAPPEFWNLMTADFPDIVAGRNRWEEAGQSYERAEAGDGRREG